MPVSDEDFMTPADVQAYREEALDVASHVAIVNHTIREAVTAKQSEARYAVGENRRLADAIVARLQARGWRHAHAIDTGSDRAYARAYAPTIVMVIVVPFEDS